MPSSGETTDESGDATVIMSDESNLGGRATVGGQGAPASLSACLRKKGILGKRRAHNNTWGPSNHNCFNFHGVLTCVETEDHLILT